MFVIFHVSSIKNPWPCAKEVAKLILSKIKLCSKADQRGKSSFKVLVHFPTRGESIPLYFNTCVFLLGAERFCPNLTKFKDATSYFKVSSALDCCQEKRNAIAFLDLVSNVIRTFVDQEVPGPRFSPCSVLSLVRVLS